MDILLYKKILSATAIAITFYAFFPYIRAIIRGKIKPHVFSWIVWGLTTFVVFLAQLEGQGGVGAWPIGISGVITIFVAFLAYRRRTDISITKVDWLFFVAALSSLPFWYLTSDPLSAVVILTIVDVLGFGPTLRKAYSEPHSESITFFGLFMLRNLLVVMALENHTMTTVLFPAAIALTSLCLILVIMYQRVFKYL